MRSLKIAQEGLPLLGKGFGEDNETVILEVISTRPERQFLTGWLIPWWPNFSFSVRPPAA